MTFVRICSFDGRRALGRTRSPKATFSKTDMCGIGHSAGRQNHLPAAHVAADHVLIVELDRPAAGVWLLQSGDDPQERRLAEPEGPSRATSSPAATVRLTSAKLGMFRGLVDCWASMLMAYAFCARANCLATRPSMNVFAASVTRPSMARSDARAKAAE